MAKRSIEIRTRQGEIRNDLDELEKKIETDGETEDTRLRFEALSGEWDELVEELKPIAEREEKLARIRNVMAEEKNREDGFGAPSLVTRTARDPFKDLDMHAVRSGVAPASEVRARALGAIEMHAKRSGLTQDQAQNATKLVERRDDPFLDNNGAVARHVLLTGTDDYRDSFANYLKDPGGYSARVALSLTNVNGGYLVPYTLDPTIILTNTGSANPWRSLATNKQTTTNDWNGVTSAGVNAAWLAEATEVADSSPTVGPLKITPQKASAWVYGSYEVLEDSDFAQQFPYLMSDAKDRLEEAAFATGAGTGGVPKGVITAATTTVTSTAGATTAFSAADVFALQGQLGARWRGPGSRDAFVGNLAAINRARQLVPASGINTSLVDDSQYPPRVLGYPFLESTTMVGTLTTTGSKVLLFGDMTQFYIVDRIGMSVMYEPMVKGTGAGRPTGQAGWFAFWRVGSDITTPQAFRVLVSS